MQVRRTRHQMYKGIDPDYYGFRDDEDGVLEKVEAEAEKLMRAEVGGWGLGQVAGAGAGAAGCALEACAQWRWLERWGGGWGPPRCTWCCVPVACTPYCRISAAACVDAQRVSCMHACL